MNTVAWSLLAGAVHTAQSPEPTPTDPGMTLYTVTPGISGFLAFFAVALACWLLFRSLGRQMRRVEQTRLRRAEEDAAAAAETSGDGTAGTAAAAGDADAAAVGEPPTTGSNGDAPPVTPR
ncbi:hypothetical protein [Georgenia sunbinii]|uniref:hypothetical protein n=1 Tax=Georgenia sunbinii TaxID=3117728 RepID=UPI002F267561